MTYIWTVSPGRCLGTRWVQSPVMGECQWTSEVETWHLILALLSGSLWYEGTLLPWTELLAMPCLWSWLNPLAKINPLSFIVVSVGYVFTVMQRPIKILCIISPQNLYFYCPSQPCFHLVSQRFSLGEFAALPRQMHLQEANQIVSFSLHPLLSWNLKWQLSLWNLHTLRCFLKCQVGTAGYSQHLKSLAFIGQVWII